MKRFRVGIDNYGLYPLQLSPLQTIKWAVNHGAEGVHYSGFDARQQPTLDRSCLMDLASLARENSMYLEWGGAQHIPRDSMTWNKKDLFEINLRAAEQAATIGARVLRSCSGGLMRWQPDSPMTETLMQETAAALRPQKQMLLDHQVILAIETHFEFTSFELVRLFERCGAVPGEWLGVCLDTMNCLTMLEDPVAATRRLLPWIVATHVKDGGIVLGQEGMTSFPVAIGCGTVDFPAIMRLLDSLAVEVTLSVEAHGGSFQLPVFDATFLSRFPDLTPQELARLVELSQRTAANPATGCQLTEREQWPGVCQQRMAADIIALKAIASSVK